MAHEKVGATVEELQAIRRMLVARINKLEDAKETLESEVKLVDEKIERLKAGKTE